MITWEKTKDAVDYPEAIRAMEAHVDAMLEGRKGEKVWLLEHPPLYTAGTSARAQDLLGARFPVYKTGRGGQYTYHGPGQRVAYVMADLRVRGKDVRRYVQNLEEWIIRSLADFDVKAERRDGRVGLWVVNKAGEEKIAAIGVRIRRWVTYHGIAINVAPDLGHYSGIVPCGLSTFGVTSLKAMGLDVSMEMMDKALVSHWADVFPDFIEVQKQTA
jgi:lipoyl(octanoyl) transferase